MAERWATFDCYGTLVDWEGGIRSALAELWPQEDPQRLLELYHSIEPRVQAGRELPYREVMARSLEAVAAIEALELPGARRETLAESLPGWRPFPEVHASLREVRDRGWRLAILSNTDPDLLAASIDALGVSFEVSVTAADAGSYKPAPGHWETFRDRVGDMDLHVHVAASLFHDIKPCARMRMPAIWINRLQESSDLPRAGELPDLRGLAKALAQVN
jgi:2-haloalkanoic acid dehalogenase type II